MRASPGPGLPSLTSSQTRTSGPPVYESGWHGSWNYSLGRNWRRQTARSQGREIAAGQVRPGRHIDYNRTRLARQPSDFAISGRDFAISGRGFAISESAPAISESRLRDLRVAASRSRGVDCARGLLVFPPSWKAEGAGKTGCALHPRSRVQDVHKKRTRAYRFSGGNPAFPAQWFYGLLRALPGDRAFLPPSPRGYFPRLDASVGASGPHDFAVRLSHARQSCATPRPPHPTATFVTIASRPSFG